MVTDQNDGKALDQDSENLGGSLLIPHTIKKRSDTYWLTAAGHTTLNCLINLSEPQFSPLQNANDADPCLARLREVRV